LIYRTPISPNQVTFFAILLGLSAAACWVEGSRSAMVWGGLLLWSSAIMDGADGILARAKNMQSAFGRALDGTADMVVGLSTVAACIYHLAITGGSSGLLMLGVAATAATIVQLNLYDFYKELYMRRTRVGRGGEGDTAEEAERLKESSGVKTAPWYTRLSMGFYADYLRVQERLVRVTNPLALHLMTGGERTEATAESYRLHNRSPMRFWMAVSLAPHSYLFAIFGMLDQLELYILLRLTLMSVLTVFGIVSQRKATARTLEEFQARGWL
jgi:hypothetical protein